MKRLKLLWLLLCTIAIWSCAVDDSATQPPTFDPIEGEATQTMAQLWSTSPLNITPQRDEAFAKIVVDYN